jgi:hypothetical protein
VEAVEGGVGAVGGIGFLGDVVAVEGGFGGGGRAAEILFYGGVGGQRTALGKRGLVEVVRGFDLGREFFVEIWRVLGGEESTDPVLA